MKKCLAGGLVVLAWTVPVGAAEFLGVDVCQDQVETSVVLPEESPLSIVSVEVGTYGALVILLEGDGDAVLGQVDDLMEGATGARGVGDDQTMQWSGRSLTAFGEVVKKRYVALAVSSTDSCIEEVAAAVGSDETAETAVDIGGPEVVAVVDERTSEGDAPAVAAPVVVEGAESEAADARQDFVVRGDIVHMKAADSWVDVMGVVANSSGQSYKLATFDLSFYDAAGALICVDTISVSVVKDGQERAFRDSIQCPGYSAGDVARTELQFAGGY